MLEKYWKNKNGITLIALVVTIVVLIILAGVGISMLTGTNGILNRSAKAKEVNEKQSIIENIKLDISEIQINNVGKINEEEFDEILRKYGTVVDDGNILITSKGNYQIKISDIYNGHIESILTTTSIKSWEYNISGKDIILTRYIGNDSKIFVPSSFFIDGISYNTKIRNIWSEPTIFSSNKTIESVKFDDDVLSTEIFAYAWFKECTNLKRVYNMPSNVTNWNSAFLNCTSLTSVPNIPEGVTELSGTFNNCTSLITAPKIPSSVTNMKYTFNNCWQLEGIVEITSDNVTQMEGTLTVPNNNRKSTVTVKANKDTLTYETILSQISNWMNVCIYGEEYSTIVCWGDSLTAGAGGNGTTYPSVLRKLCGRNTNVFNCGVGGENTATIAGRQGGIPYVVSKFTIPQDTLATEINLKSKNGEDVLPAIQGTMGLNPCYINNIEGNITYDVSLKKYYFTRSKVGSSVEVPENTEIVTNGMKEYRSSDVLVIWTGQNDGVSTLNISKILEQQKEMIEYANTDKYIIIGLLYSEDSVNNILESTYKEHFLDLRSYLSTDQSAYVSDEYKSDTVHLNADGYTIVGTQVYNKILSLGYISK